MKSLLFILFIHLSLTGYAQFDFGPSNYFYMSNGQVHMIDSLFEKKEIDRRVSLPSYPEMAVPKAFSRQRNRKLLTGTSVELSEFGDTVIVYLEGKNFDGDSWERDIYLHGELRCSDLKIDLGFISDIPLLDEYGEPMTRPGPNGFDEYVYPEYKALVPHGTWFCRIDSTSYEMGEFDMGKRIGVWRTYSSTWFSFKNTVVLEEKFFDDGLLVKTKNMNLVTENSSSKELEKLLIGEWFITGKRQDFLYSCCGSETSCNVTYTRDSTLYFRSYASVFDRINFKKNGRYDAKRSTSRCTQGESYKRDFENEKWYVDDEQRLIMKPAGFNLVFLSENLMVVEFTCGN